MVPFTKLDRIGGSSNSGERKGVDLGPVEFEMLG